MHIERQESSDGPALNIWMGFNTASLVKTILVPTSQ